MFGVFALVLGFSSLY